MIGIFWLICGSHWGGFKLDGFIGYKDKHINRPSVNRNLKSKAAKCNKCYQRLLVHHDQCLIFSVVLTFQFPIPMTAVAQSQEANKHMFQLLSHSLFPNQLISLSPVCLLFTLDTGNKTADRGVDMQVKSAPWWLTWYYITVQHKQTSCSLLSFLIFLKI